MLRAKNLVSGNTLSKDLKDKYKYECVEMCKTDLKGKVDLCKRNIFAKKMTFLTIEVI